MTLPAFADLFDFAARMPGPVAEDDARAQAALEDASSAIRSYAGRTWCNVEGDELDWGDLPLQHRDEIVRITLAAAKRAYTNPLNVESTTTGPFSTGFADSSPDVFLTAQEKAAVRRAVASGVATPGLTTISTTREDPAGSSDLGYVDPVFQNVWVDTDDGAPLPILDSTEIG
jgi:hypothetical protein